MLVMQHERVDHRTPRPRRLGEYRDLADFLNGEGPSHGVDSSHKLGAFIHMSQGAALRLLNGEVQRPKETTLRKISDAFEVDITYIRQLAGRHAGGRRRAGWPDPELEQLSPRQQAALIELGRSIIADY